MAPVGGSQVRVRWALCAVVTAILLDAGGLAVLSSLGVALRHAHLVSFALAASASCAFAARRVFRGEAVPWSRNAAARMAIVLVLCASLRGAILAWTVDRGGWPAWLGLMLGVVVGVGALLLGWRLWVLPPKGVSPAARSRTLALAVVAYTMLLRGLYLGLPELLPDEAYYWSWAAHLDLSYLDHPPLTAWVIWLGTGLAGKNELGVRIGAWVAGTVFVGFAYAFTRELYGTRAAERTAVLAAALPFFFAQGVLMTTDTWLLPCWAAALYFFSQALFRERAWAWWPAGACVGIGALSKYTMGSLGLAVAVFVLVDGRSRKWLCRPEPYGAALLAVVLFSPVLVWNFQHDWASFAFQTVRRLHTDAEFSTGWLLLHGSILLTPVVLVAALGLLLPGRYCWLGPPGSPDEQRRRRFLRVATLVPLAPFVYYSVSHYPRFHWTGPVWIGVLPLLAQLTAPQARIAVRAADRARRGLRRALTPTIATTVALYAVGLHWIVLGHPRLPGGATIDHYFWREAMPVIEHELVQLERRTGREPVLIGISKWSIAAVLSFYGKDEWSGRIASRNLFGRTAAMWEEWSPPEKFVGRPALMIGHRRDKFELPEVRASVTGAGPIRVIPIERNGATLRHVYLQAVERYVGPAP